MMQKSKKKAPKTNKRLRELIKIKTKILKMSLKQIKEMNSK